MAMDTNKVLIWLQNFKYKWLLQNILNDPHLIELISNKLRELEQLLIQDHSDENEIDEDQCDQVNNTEVIVLSNKGSNIQIPIENENKKSEEFNRPSIRLKRIPLAEAEVYLPSAWKIPKSKRGQKKRQKNLSMSYSKRKKTKKNTQTMKSIPSSKTQNETIIKSNDARRSTRTKKLLHPPSVTAVESIQPKNDEKKKNKRKLRALDGEEDDLYILGNLSQTENSNVNNDCDHVSRYLGQNGIISQTRKINETTTRDDDFTIQLNSRQINQEKNKSLNNTTMIETVSIDDDSVPLEDQQMFEHVLDNHDNESLFTSLEITHDKTIEISSISNNNSGLNYDDCIEDITNDGIDPPPSSSSPNLDHISLST
jgi:hypothetical protein